MAKLTLSDVSNLSNESSALAAINANSTATETAMENTLSRDGTSPNQMEASLDMNSNRIINLPAPVSDAEPLRLSDANTLIGGGTIYTTPSGGSTGDVLAKNSATDYDIEWLPIIGADHGGTGVANNAASTITISGSFGTTLTVSATTALTLPTTGTLATLAGSEILTNKTLTTPVINGLPTGTGVASAATVSTLVSRDASGNSAFNNITGGYTTTATAAGTTTLTVASTRNQFFTGTTTQTVLLPVASTLGLGHQFYFENNSTGLLTIQSSGGNTIAIIPTSGSAFVTCILASGTGAASWHLTTNYTDVFGGKILTVQNTLTFTGTDGSAVAFGTGGTVLYSGGAVVTVKKQIFTASGTYTPSAGMLYCVIECVGAGGGGGSSAGTVGNIYSGAGGGSGSYSRLLATAATIGASKTVTIGGGGAGGASGSNNGAAGGDTSVSTLCIGKGGSGGKFGSNAQVPTAGAGGVAGTGDLTASGTSGLPGFYNSSSASIAFPSGNGGSSYFGGGAQGVNVAAAATAGVNGGAYGAGGSGANSVNIAANAAGGNGSDGVVFITEYCSQ